jgi:hypothetical protein
MQTLRLAASFNRQLISWEAFGNVQVLKFADLPHFPGGASHK